MIKKLLFLKLVILNCYLLAGTNLTNPNWGTLRIKSDPKFQWQQVAPGDGGTSWYLRIHPNDDRTLVQSCDMTASYITFDASKSYQSINNSDWVFPRLHYISGVDFAISNSNIGYACTEMNGLFKTIDKGKTWQEVSTKSLEKLFKWKFRKVPMSAVAVHPANPDEVWFGIGFPRRLEFRSKRRLPQGLAKSIDGGKTWQHISNAFPKQDMALGIFMFKEFPNVVIVGTDHGIYRSDDNGTTFKSIAKNLPSPTYFGGFDAIIHPKTGKIVIAAALESEFQIIDKKVINTGGIWMLDDENSSWRDLTGNLKIPSELLANLPDLKSGMAGSPFYYAATKVLWRNFLARPDIQKLFNDDVLCYRRDPKKFHILWRKERSRSALLNQWSNIIRNNSKTIIPSFHTVKIDPRNIDVVYASVFEPIVPYGLWKTSNGGKSWFNISRGSQNWESKQWQQYVPKGEKKLNLIQAWTSTHPMNYGTPRLTMGFWDIRKFDLSKSNPDVLYFHSHRITYRSDNAGKSWTDASNIIIDSQQGRFHGAGNSNMCVFNIEFTKNNPQKSLMIMADCGLKISNDASKTIFSPKDVMIGSNQWVLAGAIDPQDENRFYFVFDCRDWLVGGIKGRYFLETKDFGKSFLNTKVNSDGSSKLPPVQKEFNSNIANLLVDPNSPKDNRRFIATHTQLERMGVFRSDVAFATKTKSLGIIESTDGGKSWHPLNSGLQENKEVVDLIATEDFKTLYAAVAKAKKIKGPGGLYKSIDSGKKWTKLNTPIDSISQVVKVNNSLYIAGGIRFHSGKTIPNTGGVFVSNDEGKSWQKLLAAPLVSTLAVSPSNPKIIYCTIEPSIFLGKIPSPGVYRSNNAGKTWNRINSNIAGAFHFTRLKFHPTKTNQVWLGTYGTGFYCLEDPEL